jgi:O-antigen/teichoic acid export membrane protein
MFPQRFLRDLSLQTTGNYLSTALLLARGVVLARLLGPASLGIYATVGLVIAYASYADLGMGSVPNRTIPLALGAGKLQEAEEWRWYGITASVAAAMLAAICLMGYVLARWTSLQPDLRLGLLTACVVLVMSALGSQQQMVFRAHRQFGRLNVLVVLTAVVGLAAGVVGALADGVRGVFVGQVVAFVIAAAVGVALGGLPRPRPIHAAFLLRMLKAGIPFAVIGLVSYNLINVDQVMVVALLGSDALGTYMPVLYAGSAVALFPNALQIAMSSRLLQRYGQNSSMEAIAGLTWGPVEGLAAVMPLLCGLAWVLGPWGIVWVLPDYAAAIGPLRVYLVGVFFLGLNMGTSTVLYAINKHPFDIPIVLGSIVLNVLLDLAFVRWAHWGLMGIALGSMCAYFAYWMAHTTLVRHYFGVRVGRSLLQNLASGWPGLVLAAADVVAWTTGNLWGPATWFGILLLVGCVTLALYRWRGTRRRTARPREAENGSP